MQRERGLGDCPDINDQTVVCGYKAKSGAPRGFSDNAHGVRNLSLTITKNKDSWLFILRSKKFRQEAKRCDSVRLGATENEFRI